MSDHRHQNAARIEATGGDPPALWHAVRLSTFIQVLAFLVGVGALIVALATRPFVAALAFSKDGGSLIGIVNGGFSFSLREPLGFEGTVKVWNAATGHVRRSLSGPSGWLRAISVSPDGSTVAVAGDSPSIELWNIGTGKRAALLNADTHNISTVRFAPSGTVLASVSNEGEIRLWNLARMTRPQVEVDRPDAYDICFTSDGQTVAVSGDGGIAFLNTRDGHVINETRGKRLGFLGYTKNSEDFLLTRYEGHHGEKKTILNGATLAAKFSPRLFSRSRPQLSPDGRMIAFADDWGSVSSVSIVEAVSGRTLVRGDGLDGAICALAFSPDGGSLAAADESGAVCVWDAATGSPRIQFTSDDPLQRWGPPVLAFIVCGLATLFVRRAKRRAQTRAPEPMRDSWLDG